SSNGLRSAAAAGMAVGAVPHPAYPPQPDAIALARLTVPNLAELSVERVAALSRLRFRLAAGQQRRAPRRQNEGRDAEAQELVVPRGGYRMHAEVPRGPGQPVVLMHGLPDTLPLYDRLLPHLSGRRPVVRFDFLGWGRSDKPRGYPYTADNQTA